MTSVFAFVTAAEKEMKEVFSYQVQKSESRLAG